jgi:adenylate cyclase
MFRRTDAGRRFSRSRFAKRLAKRLRPRAPRGPLGRLARRIGLGRVLATALLGLLLAVRYWDPAPVEAVRVRTFDAFQVLRPASRLDPDPMVIADIDEASLRELGQWPWPRTRVAELCRRLTAAGALVIAFDIVFAEPDRLSPPLLADTLPGLAEDIRAQLRAQPSNDALLADAIGAGRVVLGQTASNERTTWTGDGPPPATGMAVVGAGQDATWAIIRFPGLVRNVPVLEQAAAGRGVFTISPERDGVIRRVPMIVRAGEAVVPTLSLEIVRVLTEASSLLVQTDRAGVAGIRLPDLFVPTDARGRVWVRHGPHDPGRFISARDILSGRVPPERIRDKIVLVGASAIGLFDNRTTPLERAMPGVEIHAQLLENLLTGSMLVSVSYALAFELLVTIVVSVAIIVFAPILGAFNVLFAGAAVAALIGYGSWYAYTRLGILVDATFPLNASFLVWLTLVFTNYIREQLGRARIRSAFGQYLSPALVERLAASPEHLKLGGEERRLTVMFSDMRGFTTVSEFYKRDPAGLINLINRCLTPLTNAILDHAGTIDKYMGDAIVAFWNAPLDDAEHEINAVAAALDMLERLDALNAERRTEAEAGGYPVLPLDIGIGINTGACVVGNMGSELRFDYSVLGDTVNLASRIEGQSAFYGVRIILGAQTADAVRDVYPVLEIDRIQVKGKREPETISAVVGDAGVRDSPRFARLAARHVAMIAAYRARDWRQTGALADECRALAADLEIDGLYRLYRDRADRFEAEPPPAGWSGIHVAETK